MKFVILYLKSRPKCGDKVSIKVKSELKLDQLIGIVMTRQGTYGNHQSFCNFSFTCNFEIIVKDKMMPQFTVQVYHVKNGQNIFHGETVVDTEGISCNNVRNYKFNQQKQ